MSDRFDVKITATNQSSAAFQQVTRDAERMGQSVEQSGQRGARGLEDMRQRMTAVGAAAGTVVAGMSFAGQSFVAQEQQIRGLQRAYGESADEIERFADRIQQTTVYSDDAARQAAQIASTLQRSYGLTTDQITTLISRTADLAAVNVTSTGAQFSLADAVSRTAGAIRGEGEAAEALGLTLSDSAVAAEAAARGLTGWTTTMTEAEKAAFRFQLLMEQSTYAQGAAAEAAETNSGQMRQLVNQFQDMTQSVGDALGPLGEYTAVMGDMALALPLVGAGLGKVAAGLAAVGLGLPALAGLAALGGAGAFAYNLNTQPGGWAENFWADLNIGAAGGLDFLLPGNPFAGIREQYKDVKESGQLIDLIGQAIYLPPGAQVNDESAYTIGRLKTAGLLPMTFNGNINDAFAYIEQQAQYVGATTMNYVQGGITTSGAYVYDPMLEQYVYKDQLTQLNLNRAEAGRTDAGSMTFAPGTGGLQNAVPYNQPNTALGYTPYGPGQTTGYIDITGSSGTTHGQVGYRNNEFGQQPFPGGEVEFLPWVKAKQAADEYRASLEALYGAYAGVMDGITTVADAQRAFKATQDGLIEGQGQYTGQLSEYQTQLGYLTDAEDLLNERRAAGVELTKEQEDFLNRVDDAQARLQGGTEDATLALGAQALQYAENMKLGDELNANFKNSTASVDALTETLNALILALGGVPPDVQTAIHNNADEVTSDVNAAYEALNQLDGTNATASIVGSATAASAMALGVSQLDQALALLDGSTATATVVTNHVTTGNLSPNLAGLHGGVMGYANGGTVIEAAEAGGELLWMRNGQIGMALTRGLYDVPRGTYVSPAPASKAALSQSGSGGGIHLHNPTIYIYPATGDVQREFTSALVGDWRG